jgi:hypothetical protein
MSVMRAKMVVDSVKEYTHSTHNEKIAETLSLRAVCANKYPEDGLDENNTYAKFTPSATLTLQVTNPALFDKFNSGDKFYIDFTPAPN